MIRSNYARVFLLLSLYNSAIYSRIIIQGDSNAAAGTSFSFDVFPSVGIDNLFYVGRSSTTDTTSDDSIRQYSLSGVAIGLSRFLPLAPTLIKLNNVADQPNPLIGQQISALGIYKGTPAVVCADSPSDMYWMNTSLGTFSIGYSSIIGVKDAQGARNTDGSVTAGVIDIASSKEVMFAAVKKSGGTFGQVGSGIAVLAGSLTGITQIPAVFNDLAIKAVPLDGTQPFLTIGSTPTLSGSIIDMYWDEDLQRLYIVFQSTGGAAGSDGAVGIAMGYMVKSEMINQSGQKVTSAKLILNQWIPKNLIVNKNSIVAGIGSNTVASIRKVRVIHTTTGLAYLIVVGNSSSTNNQQTVYALPIVDKSGSISGSTAWTIDPSHGVLASKILNPGTNLTTFYNYSIIPPMIKRTQYSSGRAFLVAPTVSSELTTEADPAAQVGSGITIGAIQDIAVYKDAVFVSTVTGTNDVAGVFYSQAIFDVNGAIKAWTPWQRVLSAPDSSTKLYGISLDILQGRMFALQGGSSTTVDTVFSSTWSPADEDGVLGGTTTDVSVGFNNLLQQTFANNGGMFGLFDFPKNTVGFDQTIGTRTSLMIATGYEQVVLVETGFDNEDDYFIPRIGNFLGADNKTFTNGTISSSPTSNTYIITMSGGALANLGAITTATIGEEDTIPAGTYIIIGGTGGLAVLRADNGLGSNPLQKSFNGLNGFSWFTLGSYTNIRKVLCDDQNLYVLTNSTFDRIPLIQLSGNTLTPYTLATPTSLGASNNGSFSDVVVSGDFALLATNNGLYTTGIGGVVATATTVTGPLWQRYTLSQEPFAITRLVPFSRTGFSYDVAKHTVGGEIDVLASSVGQKLSSIYRLTVGDATGGVTNTTLQSIADGIFFGITGPYVDLGNYKNYYTTDGAVPLVTRSVYLGQPALLQALPKELTLAIPFTGTVARHMQSITFQVPPINISGFVRNSAVGSNIVVTSSGLQILE